MPFPWPDVVSVHRERRLVYVEGQKTLLVHHGASLGTASSSRYSSREIDLCDSKNGGRKPCFAPKAVSLSNLGAWRRGSAPERLISQISLT